MKRILIFTNSLKSSSESFILNHIRFVSNFFETSVMVQNSTIVVPKGVHLKEVILLNIPDLYFNRIWLVIKILTKNFSSYFHFLNPFKYGRNALNLSLVLTAYALEGKKFDIIHSHFGNNGLLIAQLKKEGVIKSKLITHFHGIDFTGKKYTSKYYKDLIHFGEINIVVTEFSFDSLVKLGFFKNRIKKISVGTDVEFFKRIGLMRNDEIFKILFVGRLIDLKGVLLLPEIAKCLLDNDFDKFKFTVIGNGPLENRLKNNIYGLEKYFELLGFQAQEKIKDEMENSDILIYPGIKDKEGRVENQCVIIQEAGAMRLPSIASNIGGIPEFVIDRRTGLLIDSKDIEGFSKGIIILYQDYNLKNELGMNARTLAEEKYNLIHLNREIKKLYV